MRYEGLIQYSEKTQLGKVSMKKEPQLPTTPLSEDRIKGSYGIGVGLFMFMGLGLLAGKVSMPVLWLLTIPSFATFVAGSTFYVKSKGYSPLFGVLGFGAVFGLILLILLPDRNDKTMQETLQLQRLLKARHDAKKEAEKNA